MKTSSLLNRIFLAISFFFIQQIAFAQPTVTLSPNTTQYINTGGTVSFTADRGNDNSWPGGNGDFIFTWSSNSAGVTFTNNPRTTEDNTSSTVATFSLAGTYLITCSVTEKRNGQTATSASTTVIVSDPTPLVTISPSGTQSTTIGQSINFTGTRNFNWAGGNGTFTYTWSTDLGYGVSFSTNSASTTNASSSTTATFTSAGTHQLTCTVTENGGGLTVASATVTINVYAANLWATSSAGTQISAFSVSSGSYNTGPVNLFAASYPGANNTYTRTAALGRSAFPNPNSGHFYWLGTSDAGNVNDGLVEVFAASATGGTPTRVATLDLNGSGNGNELGFVRLAVGPEGTGWILAGDGTTLILAKFQTNGVNPTSITVEDASVTISGGAIATFQNGDICLSGNGNIYALANDGSGVTQLFIGTPAGANTTLTKRLDLVDENNATFNGSVNGMAFDLIGSIYLSTSVGLHYINKNTVNGPAGTVQCTLVRAITGIQDLASNVWPQNAILPVNLISFSATYNNGRTQLNWESADEVNFSHYEVERMSDTRRGYETVAQKMAAGNAGRITYQILDDISGVFETAIHYRLKMVDQNGTFKYSPVVLVRKAKKDLSGLLISPNPIGLGNTQATLHVYSGQSDQIRIRVLDAAGRPVLQQVNTVNEGANSVLLQNMHQLQSGMYLIQLQQGTSISTTRLVIAK